MYTDMWRRNKIDYKFGPKKTIVRTLVYFSYLYDGNKNKLGVSISFETERDFHYELLMEDWLKFCNIYLNGKDSHWAFKRFFKGKNMKSTDGLFAFEHALNESNIEFKKIAYY